MSKSPEDVLLQLIDDVATLHMASIRPDGSPNLSYAPFLLDENGAYYIFVSQLASHTEDLLTHPTVTIMLSEDEKNTRQIFARTRLTYTCSVEEVLREDKSYQKTLDLMAQKFGNIINLLRDLPDFILFKLVPKEGRFVMGFGQAYILEGEALQRLKPIKNED
ncbi:MAG TPA: HugZ family protein [Thiothrix sp.]|nr:HugZ family protein [Thiothrix sp.]